MSSDTVREFDEKGYVLVRDVLDAQTVQRLRKLLLGEFKGLPSHNGAICDRKLRRDVA